MRIRSGSRGVVTPRRRLAAGPLAGLLVLAGCTGAGHADGPGTFRFHSALPFGELYPVSARAPAGPVTGPLLDGGTPGNGGVAVGGGGGTFRLADDMGKVVVVNFWASDCGPCRTESPQFDSVYRAYKDRGVDFVGMDIKDLRAHAKSFVRAHHISYPIVYDRQARTAIELGDLPASAIPFTALVDKHGDVAAVYVGAMQSADLEPVLDRLLAET